jgi:Zn-dependent protease
MAFQAFLQVTAFLINILPVPGLDGYSALEPHLSPQTQRALQPAKGWAFLILLLLLFTPQVNRLFFGVVDWFFGLSGISTELWLIGSQLTRFWSAWF